MKLTKTQRKRLAYEKFMATDRGALNKQAKVNRGMTFILNFMARAKT